jgi:hypothetical protein
MGMRVPTALLAACLFACGPPRYQSAFFSFEGSLQGWAPHGLDLQSGGAEEAWDITSDPAAPFDGASSARFFLDNANGAGKIWLERTFTLSTAGRHVAHVELAVVGTRDAIAADQLIAGVLSAPPRDADALQPALQAPGIAGSRWTPHAVDLEVQGGTATVVIGIAGRTPGRIVYHLDAVTVLFTDAP